jgi:hypothetical protein
VRIVAAWGARSFAFLFVVLIAGSTGGLGQIGGPGRSTLTKADDLPAPGYCPPTAEPSCPTKLEAYARAYRVLLDKTRSYYAVLGEAFGDPLWTERVSAQQKELLEGFDRTEKSLVATLVTQLKAYTYVNALKNVLAAKSEYEKARDAWVIDPLSDAKAVTARQKQIDYHDAIRKAYESVDGFSGHADQMASSVLAAENITKSLKEIQAKLKQPPDFANFAEAMRRTQKQQQQQGAEIEIAYAEAKSAAEVAVQAGAKLERRPESTADRGNVVIVDALYGWSDPMGQTSEAWLDAKKKDPRLEARLEPFLPRDKSGKLKTEYLGTFCYAHDYVKASCEYVEALEKFCLHKDVATKPEYRDKPEYCDTTNFTIPYMTRQRVLKSRDATVCSLTIQPEVICGGVEVQAPAPERHALILYRCGAGRLDIKIASSNKRTYLFCG